MQLQGGVAAAAHAATNLCGDGIYDSIVGQYTGAHPDGSYATDAVFQVGGTGILNDVVGLGGGPAITLVGPAPNGTPAFGSLTWRKVKSHQYVAKIVSLQGFPTVLQPTDLFGVFPLVNFNRTVATVNVVQSSDCSTVDAYVVNVCAYGTGTIADMNVNTVTPIGCADFSANPLHLATNFKVAAP